MLQHFIDEKLALSIRIACIDHRVGLTQQLADNLELRRSGTFDRVFPVGGDDGQMFPTPLCVFRRIGFGVGGFEHVPEAPGDNIVAAADAPGVLAAISQALGDGLSQIRFFGNEKSHITSSCAARRQPAVRVREWCFPERPEPSATFRPFPCAALATPDRRARPVLWRRRDPA